MRWCRILHLNTVCPAISWSLLNLVLESATFGPHNSTKLNRRFPSLRKGNKTCLARGNKNEHILFRSATIYQLHMVCYRKITSTFLKLSFMNWFYCYFCNPYFFIQNENEQILDSSNTLFPTPKTLFPTPKNYL